MKFFTKIDDKIQSPQNIVNIILSVTLFCLFITIFFFTYTAYIEKKIVTIQLQSFANSVTNIFSMVKSNKNIKEIIHKHTHTIDTNADISVIKHNHKIIQRVILTCLIFTICTFSIIAFLTYKYKIELFPIIFRCLITIIFIAITEIMFINIVTINYQNINNNKIKQYVLEILLSFHHTNHDISKQT